MLLPPLFYSGTVNKVSTHKASDQSGWGCWNGLLNVENGTEAALYCRICIFTFFFFWKKGRNPSRAWCQPLRHALLSMMPGLAVFTVLLSSFAWSPTLVITSCLTDTGLCLKSFSLSFQFGVGCLFVFWTLGFLPLSFTFQQSLPNYIRFF